jgi:AGZA family xanthine/uracil permease-like MFS transporter
MVPSYATAGALVYVAILMLGGMEKLDWSDNTELLPALIMIIMIPLTFSIANGIAIGFISYVVLKFAAGKKSDISGGAWLPVYYFYIKIFSTGLSINELRFFLDDGG